LAKKLATGRSRRIGSRNFECNFNCHASFERDFQRPVFWPMSQFLTGHSRNLRGIIAVAMAIAAALAVGCRSTPAPTGKNGAPERGGELVVSVRTEPQSFSWFTQRDATTELVTFLTQAKLFRVNRATQDVEPWLAERSTRSDDGRLYTVKLRPNVTFADGQPFTADDVVFSFAAAYDQKGGSQLAGDLMAGGKALAVAAADPTTVVITFPEPFGPGLRLLDNLPILPKHKLESALKAGTFASAWGLSTPLADITGLGPFVLSEYAPGQRLVFARNERYFRKDANGAALPYLDRIIVEIVQDQNAQMLRLEAGQSDMTASEVRPEDYAPLKRAADAGRVQLLDLGGALDADSFWINLKPGAFGSDPRASWLQRDELRQAISLAVDRQAFADAVLLGAGVPVFGPVTPANKKWFASDVPHPPHDPARAKELLVTIGLRDRNGDGLRDDSRGAPARFTLITQKGQTALERGAAVIRDELKKIGLTVDVVALEGNAVVQRLVTGQGYEATYFHLGMTDTDPALTQDYWLSSGNFHVWNPGQKTPATAWERQIDDLIGRQTSALDDRERKRLFDEVQRIFAEHLPIVHFAAPRIFVAASARVTNLTPAVQRPQLLWSADTIAVRR
jgi:peptide/nickel transport system substrate-binding protein